MIRILPISIFFLLFAHVLLFSTDWEEIIFDPDVVDLTCVDAASENVAAAVGICGYVKITTDGGVSWTNSIVQGREKLNFVCCQDEFIFQCFGEKGSIYKTINRGNSWQKINTGITESFLSASFHNSRGLVVGENGKAFKTTNYGDSWAPANTNTKERLNDVEFVNNKTVYAVGNNGTLIRSTDTGDYFDTILVGYECNFLKIDVVKDSNIFILGDSLKLIYSNDGGKTWKESLIETAYSKLYKKPVIVDFTFFNENIGHIRVLDLWASLPRYYEYVTNNGGAGWSYKILESSMIGGIPDNGYNLTYIKMKNDSLGYGVGSTGNIYKISVAEDLFYEYQMLMNGYPYKIRAIDAASETDFAIVSDNGASSKYLWLSSDAGDTWEKTKLNYPGFDGGTSRLVNASYPAIGNLLISFNNEKKYTEGNTTYYVQQGFILRTTNNGKSFTEHRNSNIRDYVKVEMINNDYGFIFQYGDTIAQYTNDGGISWTDVPKTDTSDYVAYLDSPAPGLFYALFAKGYSTDTKFYYAKSYDYGSTWNYFDNSLANQLGRYKFFDENNGWGWKPVNSTEGQKKIYYNEIIKTSDGGETWAIIHRSDTTSKQDDFNKFDISGENFPFFVGRRNISLNTTDEGQTWERDSCSIISNSDVIRDVSYPSKKIAIAFTDRNRLIRKGSITVGVEEENPIVEDDKINIYPMPASDMVNVRFLSEAGVAAHYELYDCAGRVLYSSVEAIQSSGLHSCKLDFSNLNLSAGIFFLKIQLRDKTVFMKIIIAGK